MEPKDRIIVALDVKDLGKVKTLTKSLAPYVGGFKIGLELQTAVGGPQAVEVVHSLGGQVFYDGKFKDVPNTVAGAAWGVTNLGVKMFNVHCKGGIPMMRAAGEATDKAWIEVERQKVVQYGSELFQTKPPIILGVTLLTSMDFDDLVALGLWEDIIPTVSGEGPVISAAVNLAKHKRVQELVASLAKSAEIAGLDGVVCSPQEITIVRNGCRDGFLIVTPGIRSSEDPPDDQKRTLTAGEAIGLGADYLVIGRPITNKADPVAAAQKFAEEIAAARPA